MSNDLNKHKKSDSVKWFITLIAIILLAVSVMAAITKGFKDWNPYGWLDKKTDNVVATDENGNSMLENTIYTMPKNLIFRTLNEEKSSEIRLRATVLPEDATNKSVVWSINWKGVNTEFSNNKNVRDYVDFTVDSNDLLLITLNFISRFSDPIEIKVTSVESLDKYAICQIDCERLISNVSLAFSETGYESAYPDIKSDLNWTNSSDIKEMNFLVDMALDGAWHGTKIPTITPEYTLGTVDLTGSFSITLDLTQSCYNKLRSLGLEVNYRNMQIDMTNGILPNRNLLQNIFGSSIVPNSGISDNFLKLIEGLSSSDITEGSLFFNVQYKVSSSLARYSKKFYFNANIIRNSIPVSSVTLDNTSLTF